MNDDAIEQLMPHIDSGTKPLLVANAPPFRDEPHLRAAADPLGFRRLPTDRAGLDDLLRELCRRLIVARGEFLGGGHLATSMGLRDTRALRLLVAYGRVHHRIREIVSIPGSGYCWGTFRPELYESGAAQFRRMGLCHLFVAGLLRRRAPAVEFAQLALDFVRESRQQPTAGTAPDELQVWMAAEDLSAGNILDAMIDAFGATEDGRAALRDAGARHRELLVPRDVRDRLLATLRELEDEIATLAPAG